MNLKTESWAVLCPTNDPYESIPEVIKYLKKEGHYKNEKSDYYINRYFGLDVYGQFDTWAAMEYVNKYFEVILTYEEFLECINLKKEISYEIY